MGHPQHEQALPDQQKTHRVKSAQLSRLVRWEAIHSTVSQTRSSWMKS